MYFFLRELKDSSRPSVPEHDKKIYEHQRDKEFSGVNIITILHPDFQFQRAQSLGYNNVGKKHVG